MGVYLGSNDLLGGGGGAIPIGGVKYFIPPIGTTFTSGQEVYTDPDDSTVWLRSGAELTSSGTGALESSQYRDSRETLVQTTTHINMPTRSDRTAFSYDGANFIGVGYYGSTNPKETVKQEDGTQMYSTAVQPGDAGGSRSFFNSTHSFISQGESGGSVPKMTGNRYSYVQTSTLTNQSGYNTAINGSTYYLAPANAQYGCATNIGLTGERYWFASVSSTTITEYTFDDTTSNGGSPWTATGNTITSVPSIRSITSSGENIVYVLSGNSLLEYNATTRALITTNENIGNNSPIYGDGGLAAVPSDRSNSGNLEIYTQTTVGSSNSNNSSSTNNTLYNKTELLTAPHGGTTSSKTAVTLRQAATGTSLSVEEVKDGRNASDQSIYLWIRIA